MKTKSIVLVLLIAFLSAFSIHITGRSYTPPKTDITIDGTLRISEIPTINESITLSKSFTANLERDFFDRDSYYGHTHTISATFNIIGFNDTIQINVIKDDGIGKYISGAPGFTIVHPISSMKVILKYKSNSSIVEKPITTSSSINVSSYKDFLFQFYYEYSYSYIGCTDYDNYFCYDSTTLTSSGQASTDFKDFQLKSSSSDSIPGYNVFIIFSIIAIYFMIIVTSKRMRRKRALY